MAAALDVPLDLRIDRELDAYLRQQAAEAHVTTLAPVRRLLRQAVQELREQLTAADVESLARRVAREELRRPLSRRGRAGRASGWQPSWQPTARISAHPDEQPRIRSWP